MIAALNADELRDDIAVSLAKALAAANKHARQLGVDVDKSRLSISQRSEDGKALWRISYGPKDYVGRRGGDLIIDVSQADGLIQNVLSGQ
jgi:hypothetical protein